MGAIGEQHFAPRVGLEGIGFLLEAGSINRQMTGLATIHASYRLVETVAVELIERNLLDLGDFEESSWDRA